MNQLVDDRFAGDGGEIGETPRVPQSELEVDKPHAGDRPKEHGERDEHYDGGEA